MFAKLGLKRFHRTSFRNKLVLTYILLIFIPVVSALFINSIQLYNQTKSDYEGILEQLNRRTNVIVDDFFNNLVRNSFFYSTETRLHAIVSKTKPQGSMQYNLDANYMQTAMGQFVLMNGNIASISVLAPNGSIYSSQADNASNIVEVIEQIGRPKLISSNFVVSVRETAGPGGRTNQLVSIVRYLSDLIVLNDIEGYAKVDVHFKAIEHMLGGITDSGLKLGTLVFADDRLIYSSDARLNGPANADAQKLSAQVAGLTADSNRLSELEWGGQPYLVSASLNPSTGWKIVQFIPTNQMLNTFIHNALNFVLFSVMALLAAFLLAYFFNRYFIEPIMRLSRAMKTIDSGPIYNAIPWSEREDEIGRLLNSYNSMIERLNTSREAELVSNELQKKAELRMLQAQINPHFLYNTLNTIHSISELHRLDDVSTMTKSLSSMYRFNIKYGDEVTVEKELEQIGNYIQIQQIRFVNRFQVEYDISPDVLQCRILKFLIQPIVENSFYHGLEPKGGQGVLKLAIRRHGHTLLIRVQDNGIGMSESKIAELTAMFEQNDRPSVAESERNFGLRNVYSRIKHFYGEGYGMKVTGSEQEGTCIEMHIPFNEGDEHR